MTAPRQVVANLDVEAAWACSTGATPAPLSRAARMRASHLGLLAAVLAPDAATLWTPEPVDPACRWSVPGLPAPALRSGSPHPEPGPDLLFWGDPDAAAVNDRRWAHELAQAHDLSLPGAAFVSSPRAFAAHRTSRGAWVLKAPFSAAGRERALGQGRVLTLPQQRQMDRLFQAYGTLLLEPWLMRIADFGCTVWQGRVRMHKQRIDARGRFLGIDPLEPHTLPPAAGAALLEATELVGRALAKAGYVGPFGVDAFRYRSADGGPRFRALCEVNARFTFGHVAAALDPAAEALWGRPRATLRLGDRERGALGEGEQALIGSAKRERVYAWMARDPQPDG